ncbi:acyl-CoA synthetase (AMP-forming)/AMP-acid ligase II [Pseudomonas migulae]|uniref:AMP-binding enzyme n=1 Tax=Pseudomonas migulae TaxID=78543 RepID=UPI002646A0D8|nr:hypothetical protein [Pseudomonas migulae]MCP1500968.1 acyl-CoA synthetase (AMP-forming)/AMP-acid ligase II [Pseudomonas migulae]
MAHAVRFYETGGPEVLRYEEVEVGDPGPGQVRLRHVAVGLNYADTYFRNGTYPIPMPNGMGVEASGVVQAIGGERPMALVVCEPGQYLDRKMLEVHLQGFVERGRINKWAIPKQFKFVPEIPKTSVGKINKKLIRESELG